jgi:hypothetical protein
MLSSHIPEAMLEEKKEPVSIASQDIERAIISPLPRLRHFKKITSLFSKKRVVLCQI